METSLIFLFCFILALLVAPLVFFIVLWANNKLNPPLTKDELNELLRSLKNDR